MKVYVVLKLTRGFYTPREEFHAVYTNKNKALEYIKSMNDGIIDEDEIYEKVQDDYNYEDISMYVVVEENTK